jgi:adenosylcobinamide-phosphate synthase
VSLAAGAVGVALALDLLGGEPPTRLHPVAWFGSVVGALDREWRRPRLVGALGALVLPLAAAAIVGRVVTLAGLASPLAGAVLAGICLFVTTSLRSLLSTVAGVCAASTDDLLRARERLPALAGRDPSELSAGQVRSAAVESAAENLADGLVAPLLGFTLGAGVSLGVGVAVAVWVKAVNTMDSMLGYPDRRVGSAAARLDDVVMWLPARTTALLLAVVTATPDGLSRAAAWAGRVPSPNGGWPMGALAAALDVRLEKPGVYVLNPRANLPSGEAVGRGVRSVGFAGLLAYAVAASVLLVPEVSVP